MRAGLAKWAEQMIRELAGLAVRQGSVHLAAGLKLFSAEAWHKGTTENGKPVDFTVPLILELEDEKFAFECADVSAIMDCLDLIYADFPEKEECGHESKVITFPTRGSA